MASLIRKIFLNVLLVSSLMRPVACWGWAPPRTSKIAFSARRAIHGWLVSPIARTTHRCSIVWSNLLLRLKTRIAKCSSRWMVRLQSKVPFIQVIFSIQQPRQQRLRFCPGYSRNQPKTPLNRFLASLELRLPQALRAHCKAVLTFFNKVLSLAPSLADQTLHRPQHPFW